MAYTIDPEFARIREQAFAWRDPDAFKGFPHSIIMDTGHKDAVMMLAALSNGTVSLVFSSGSGYVGLGDHAGPRQASLELAQTAGKLARALSTTRDTSLPQPGEVTIFVTIDGEVRAATGLEGDFLEKRLDASPLFFAAHKLTRAITKVKGVAPAG